MSFVQQRCVTAEVVYVYRRHSHHHHRRRRRHKIFIHTHGEIFYYTNILRIMSYLYYVRVTRISRRTLYNIHVAREKRARARFRHWASGEMFIKAFKRHTVVIELPGGGGGGMEGQKKVIIIIIENRFER